jgi:hypothetical protein
MNTIDAMKQLKEVYKAIYSDPQNITRTMLEDMVHLINGAIAREEAQTVEPFAWVDSYGGVTLASELPIRSQVPFDWKPLFTHPSPSTKSSAERAALIARLREAKGMAITIVERKMLNEAADMLAADADAYAQGKYDEEMRQGTPQQVWDETPPRQPMMDSELNDLLPTNDSMSRYDALRRVVRATERHHHIGFKP